jgi:alpha-D-xyloside xylohydrolase
MEESLRGGLSLQMSGFGFWSHDIGGFESTSTPDVYKRWCAFGLLSSHSRLHGSSSYRVPWAYDEEAVEVVRFFTRWKAKLMPYLYRTAVQAHEEGIPSMRSMVLEFTQDRMCHYLDRQYMLGDNLLVAPIFNEESRGEYYLPVGEEGDNLWTDFLTGEQQEGGKWYTAQYGYCALPLLARPNSIIAVGACEDTPEYDYAKDVLLRVFALGEGRKAETCVCNGKGQQELKIEAVRKDGEIQLQTDASKPFTIELVGVKAKEAVGAQMTVEGNSTFLRNGASTIQVRL